MMDCELACIFETYESLCLDYANTRSWRGSKMPTERLREIADLFGWIDRSAVIGRGFGPQLGQWSSAQTATASRLFGEAIDIRETIYRVFSALAESQHVQDRDFQDLARKIASAPARDGLVASNDRTGWVVRKFKTSAAHLLAPVLWSAGDLLVASHNRRIRRCANEECLWLFLDESRNGTRRWCDMTTCGNRAKARRHYAKVKQADPSL